MLDGVGVVTGVLVSNEVGEGGGEEDMVAVKSRVDCEGSVWFIQSEGSRRGG